MKYPQIIVIVVTLFCLGRSSAAPKIVLDDQTTIVEIYNSADLLIDTLGNTISRDKILSGKLDHKFKPTTGRSKYRIENSSYWLKYQLSTGGQSNFFLEAYSTTFDSLEMFVVQQGKVTHHHVLGDKQLFDSKYYKHKNFVFPLPSSNSQPFDIYMRMKSAHKDGLKMVIKSDRFFVQYALTEYWVLGIFYGILVLVIIQNLFLYWSSKSRVNLYYVGYAFFFALYTLALNGLGFQYVWPSFPGASEYISRATLAAAEVCMLLYILNVFELKQHLKWRRILLATMGLRVFVLFLTSFTTWDFLWVDLLVFTVGFITAAFEYKKHQTYAKYIVVGFCFLFISFLIRFLWVSGVFHPVGVVRSILLIYVLNLGATLEVVFFSLAITARIKSLDNRVKQSQKEIIGHLEEKQQLTEKVNRELESKVQQRTMELDGANHKLQELMDQVNQMNLELDLSNRSLEKEKKSIVKNQVLFKASSEEDFLLAFPEETDCLIFLENLKWGQAKYVCKKCGNTKYNKGVAFRSRRCSSCNYEESCTNHTLFERLRIDLRKSFYMAYLILRSDGKVTIEQLQQKTGLNKNAVWRFKKRVMDKMKSSKIEGKISELKGWDQLVLNDE